MATHSNILSWEIPWQRGLVGCSPQRHKESDTTENSACTQTVFNSRPSKSATSTSSEPVSNSNIAVTVLLIALFEKLHRRFACQSQNQVQFRDVSQTSCCPPQNQLQPAPSHSPVLTQVHTKAHTPHHTYKQKGPLSHPYLKNIPVSFAAQLKGHFFYEFSIGSSTMLPEPFIHILSPHILKIKLLFPP